MTSISCATPTCSCPPLLGANHPTEKMPPMGLPFLGTLGVPLPAPPTLKISSMR